MADDAEQAHCPADQEQPGECGDNVTAFHGLTLGCG